MRLETFAGARRIFLNCFPGIGMRVWGDEGQSKMFFAVFGSDEQINYETDGYLWRGQFEDPQYLAGHIEKVRNKLQQLGILPAA